jgi:hypothetical protein
VRFRWKQANWRWAWSAAPESCLDQEPGRELWHLGSCSVHRGFPEFAPAELFPAFESYPASWSASEDLYRFGRSAWSDQGLNRTVVCCSALCSGP